MLTKARFYDGTTSSGNEEPWAVLAGSSLHDVSVALSYLRMAKYVPGKP